MHTAVNTKSTIALELFPDCKKIYHKIHIIAALTTGAPSPTKTENEAILTLTAMTLSAGGKNQNIKVIKITQRVILNQLTAIKCVRPELLKSSLSSAGIFSLAPKRIPPKNIASFFGNILSILDRSFCLLW